MWSRTYSKVYTGITKEQIWNLWIDVSNWHKWDPDIECGRMEEPFEVGSYIIFKPKGSKEIKLELVEVEKLYKYTDKYKLFGGELFGIHEMVDTKDGLKLITAVKVTGILSFLWAKLIAEKIADTIPLQMENLINLARLQNDR